MLLVAAAIVVAAYVTAPATAIGEEVTCPTFDGVMSFPAIQGPGDPEEYCWEVEFNEEEEELRQIDNTHVGAFYGDGTQSMWITAQVAHDAEGATVPTTLALTARNMITLTVHHRAGNPAAGGAPFDYPVVQGPGWEGGFQTTEVKMSPPTEQSPVAQGPPSPTCEVPVLQGRTVKSARRALLVSGCQLGPIRGRRHLGARIVKQYRPAYKVVPAGTEVGVRLAR